MSSPPSHVLSWIPTAISVAIPFGAGYLTHALLVRREVANRKRAFRGLVRSELQKVEAIDLSGLIGGDVLKIYQASVSAIGDECAKISEDIPRKFRRAFGACWRQYCGLKQEDIEPLEVVPPWCVPAAAIRNYERGRKRVVELLRQMINCAR